MTPSGIEPASKLRRPTGINLRTTESIPLKISYRVFKLKFFADPAVKSMPVYWEMIWTHPVYKNFIIFQLTSKYLLAPHILSYFYKSHPSLWELPYGSTEPFFSGAATSPTHSCVCDGFLLHFAAPYTIEHSATCRCLISTDCR